MLGLHMWPQHPPLTATILWLVFCTPTADFTDLRPEIKHSTQTKPQTTGGLKHHTAQRKRDYAPSCDNRDTWQMPSWHALLAYAVTLIHHTVRCRLQVAACRAWLWPVPSTCTYSPPHHANLFTCTLHTKQLRLCVSLKLI